MKQAVTDPQSSALTKLRHSPWNDESRGNSAARRSDEANYPAWIAIGSAKKRMTT